uniref:Uncharacterized protein n=1 Tax=Avena sativa TaxID=4498 RepID=A0ACD5Z690_AVESA
MTPRPPVPHPSKIPSQLKKRERVNSIHLDSGLPSMAHSKIAVTALCFFLLLAVGFGKKPMPCERPSQSFKLPQCEFAPCNAACISEDYKGGYCKEVRDVGCLCTNYCHDGEAPKREISMN